MNPEFAPEPAPTPAPAFPPVPWSGRDTWLGLLLLALTLAGFLAAVQFAPKGQLAGNILMLASEVVLILPVAVIFLWRRISWQTLGFSGFKPAFLALGCGVLAVTYPLIILHNVILLLLGVETQGNAITQLIHRMDSPWVFALSAVVLAPLAEEIFFRGFLFAGFRQRYGWVPALLISSAIFGASHIQLAAFIPTFLLGAVLAYAYHRSNSIWPGMILHFLVNGTAMLITLLAVRLGAI